MGRRDGYIPGLDVLSAILSEAVLPKIAAIEAQLGISLPGVAIAVNGGMTGPRIAVPSAVEGERWPAEIRIRVRRSAVEGRSLFRAEVRLADIPTASGLTGFTIDGDVKEGSPPSVKSTGYVGRYNDRTWHLE